MPLLSIDDVSFEIGGHLLLDRASLTLERSDRICLIGRNGAGKSTLLRLIAGTEVPDSGHLRAKPNLRARALAQELPSAEHRTVFEYVATGLADLQALIDEYNEKSATHLDDKGMQKLAALQNRIEAAGGWDPDERVRRLIDEMGLPGSRAMAELSGGWRRRADLARVLVAKPELLLLDEPTNHLDLGSIEWLEDRIRNYVGCVLFVTHDRAFLENLATRIVELDRAKLTSSPGDYADFLKHKEAMLSAEKAESDLFDKRLEQEEAWIRQGIKARRTRNEGRVRALEAMRKKHAERVEVEGTARVAIGNAHRSGRNVLEVKGVAHGYGGNPIFEPFSITIRRGDRLGLIGNNGVGKTTLLQILLGELEPEQGTVKRGTKLEIAYFDQLREELDPEKTAVEIVADGDFVEVDGRNRHVLGYLKDFLFGAKRAVTKVGVLSGGERNRIVLAKLFAGASNLLVLDEPTNDLDLETLEILEQQLVAYNGTLILVSHDRRFLDNVVTATLAFEDGGNIAYSVGGFSDWAKLGRALASDVRRESGHRRREGRMPSVTKQKPKPSPTKLSYKLKLELEALPAKIQELEKRVAELQAESESPDFYTRPFDQVEPVLKALGEKKLELESVLERWMELEELRESIQ